MPYKLWIKILISITNITTTVNELLQSYCYRHIAVISIEIEGETHIQGDFHRKSQSGRRIGNESRK